MDLVAEFQKENAQKDRIRRANLNACLNQVKSAKEKAEAQAAAAVAAEDERWEQLLKKSRRRCSQ